MIVSYKLLKDLISFSYSPEELADKFTQIGIEVEKVEHINKQFDGVITAKVLEVTPLSNEKDFLVKIDTKEGIFNVVTGATNVKVNDVVPFARPNAKIKDGRVILEKTFGDVVSVGMLCSYDELGIESDLLSNDEKTGIFILPEGTPIGVPLEDVFPLEDTLLELSLLPDRADAFYLVGVARWIEILLAREEKRKADFSKFAVDVSLNNFLGQTPLSVNIVDSKHCTLYSGRLIEKVTIKNSTYPLRKLLFGLRIHPINNIVDITNFIAKMYGQPLHAFDFDKLHGNISIRLAHEGETIKTLDGVERHLTSKNLVIADEKGPVAIAGVMGGEATEVTPETKNVFLESAYFTPATVAASGRSLNLLTDASALFEKGIDPNFTLNASLLATKWIIDESKGVPYKDSVDDKRTAKSPVNLRLSKASSLLGYSLSKEEVKTYFDMEGLPFNISQDTFSVEPPSFRHDLEIEEDLVEEIARMKGYNEFIETPIVAELRSGSIEPTMKLNDHIREIMCNFGLTEIVTSTLTNEELLAKFSLFDESSTIKIINPLTEDMSYLRPSLFPNAVDVAKRNMSFQINELSLFEIGKVFYKKDSSFKEEFMLGVFLSQDKMRRAFSNKTNVYDYFYLKGIFEGLCSLLKVDCDFVKSSKPFMHPYQTAEIFFKNISVGFIGKIHPDIFENAFYGELNLSALYDFVDLNKKFEPFSQYPSVKRDIAIIVDKDIEEAKVRKAIKESGIKELKDVVLFDVYQGDPLPPHKKNLAYALEFVSTERTLTSEEVDKFVWQIEQVISKTVNGVIRRQ